MERPLPGNMTNPEIADAFDQIADILEFQGANQFRVRAYRNAARTIRDLPEVDGGNRRRSRPQADRHRGHRQGPGREDRRPGGRPASCRCWRSCKQQVPESVLAMMRVPGLGPKRAAMLFKELKVDHARRTPRGLREPTRSANSRASGAKTEDVDPGRPGIRRRGRQAGPLGRGRQLVQEILAHMRGCPAVEQIEAAGSYRRGKRHRGRPGLPGRRQRRRGRDGPHGRLSAAGRGAGPRRDEAHRSGCGAACTSISASCRPSRSARPCNTSPARRPTTSSSAAWPRTAA